MTSLSNNGPVIVGIAGGTGSGKTTVACRIIELLGEGATMIQHDWYYRDQRHLSKEERAVVNYDHPESLDNDLLVKHLGELKRGQAIEAPQYDFAIHSRQDLSLTIQARPVIVVEGILLFALPAMREVLDIKLFVDTDADIRVLRRVRRDIEHRGRDFESIRRQYYKTVRPMHMEFVEPSKRWADLIIPEGGDNHIALDVIVERLKHFTVK